MFKEFGGEPFVSTVFFCQLQRDAHQIQTEKSHPAGGIRLFENGSAGKFFAPINDSDVVEPEKASFKNIISLAVDLVHPPGKVNHQFVKTLFEKQPVALTRAFFLYAVNAPTSPGVHRRVKIG